MYIQGVNMFCTMYFIDMEKVLLLRQRSKLWVAVTAPETVDKCPALPPVMYHVKVVYKVLVMLMRYEHDNFTYKQYINDEYMSRFLWRTSRIFGLLSSLANLNQIWIVTRYFNTLLTRKLVPIKSI